MENTWSTEGDDGNGHEKHECVSCEVSCVSHERDIAADVERFGWNAVSVFDHSPPFVYTVGLMFTHEHPELIIFGLREEGYNVLRAMVEEIGKRKSFAEPRAYEGVLKEGFVATRTVHESQHELYLGYAMGYCRERGRMGQLRAVQVFWPDKAGRFPFERECEEGVWWAQRRIDQAIGPRELRERRGRGG